MHNLPLFSQCGLTVTYSVTWYSCPLFGDSRGQAIRRSPTTYPVTPASAFSWNLSGKSDWHVTGGAAFSHLVYTANFVDTFYPSNVTNRFGKDAVGWR